MPSGKWRVRWRDDSGKLKQKTFAKKGPANSLCTRIESAREAGSLAQIAAGKTPLGQIAKLCDERRWSKREPATQKRYRRTWNLHLNPYVGTVPAQRMTAAVAEDLLSALARDGYGVDAQRRALSLLRSIMARAVEWQYVQHNPIRDVPMPTRNSKRAVRPLAPAQVEQIIAALDRTEDKHLARLIAYAGLRPQEALALTPDHIRKRTILVEQAVSDGRIKATKTQKIRSVDLMEPLAESLRPWLPESGLLFANQYGQPWSESGYRNWLRRMFKPAAKEAGIDATPYTLRHSFASLLIHAGHPVTYVAAQLGHSPAVCLSTYAHVFADLDSKDFDPEEAIAAAMSDASGMT